MSDLINLACSNCGAPLKVDESTLNDAFIVVDDDTFIFIGGTPAQNDTLTCSHCGSTFERKEQVKRHSGGDSHTAVVKGNGAIAQGRNSVAVSGGGIVIGGSVRGSNIVMGSGNTVISNDDEDGTTVIISQRKKKR